MGKQKKFKLKRHDPFIVEGDHGDHEIPPLEKLSYEQWKEVAAISMNSESKPGIILAAYKEFFLRVCPELADEEIGDNQWMQLGAAYFEAMGE